MGPERSTATAVCSVRNGHRPISVQGDHKVARTVPVGHPNDLAKEPAPPSRMIEHHLDALSPRPAKVDEPALDLFPALVAIDSHRGILLMYVCGWIFGVTALCHYVTA